MDEISDIYQKFSELKDEYKKIEEEIKKAEEFTKDHSSSVFDIFDKIGGIFGGKNI
eukprot:CAMPEP_0168334130 /NCGR_PEP_ID=MMETSP0213-20121227/10065_1 /TAXON_ID=151035 /ORGANISM="Euplotes harpa, Strain FSP1.4" /LENGTH=55 /DNA_ID=CAMNT_0008338677 /DNA_START=259 /DNA_END=426 /DNA_ORIENTATION=-